MFSFISRQSNGVLEIIQMICRASSQFCFDVYESLSKFNGPVVVHTEIRNEL